MNEYAVGPFLCEWCNTPLKDVQGILREGSVVRIVGYCPKCGAALWSTEVHLPPPRKEMRHG
jgi:hypothetical protein